VSKIEEKRENCKPGLGKIKKGGGEEK